MNPSRKRLAAARVLVVGDAMLDRYWFGAVDRISPEAPVPVVKVTREEERLGGAANVALNVRTLGAQSSLVTVVGNDEPGRRLKAMIEEKGIPTLLGVDEQLYTIVKLRVIGRSQQLLRIDFENQPDHEVLKQAFGEYERVLPEHDVVLFSDYGKGGLEHISKMIERARALGKPVLVDPKGSDYARYRGATAITPNRAELAQVIGPWSSDADLATKAQALRRRFDIGGLVLTRSDEGMSLYDDAGESRVPAQAREVFDVTGAGDTVVSVVALSLAAGADFPSACAIANHAAGLVIAELGTAACDPAALIASLDGSASA
jgi:rfaE bifunctional protein kinase chain/domain